MIRLFLICGFAVSSVAVSSADPPKEQTEAVTIPLDRIWAFEMPGTKDIRELEQGTGKTLFSQIIHSLRAPLPDPKSNSGFAVRGTGLDALSEAHGVLVNGHKPNEEFPASSTVSIVFFARSSGYYVQLQSVERDGNVVRVHYRLVPHRTKELTNHFALIPLEEFSPGKVTVEIIRSPTEKEFIGFKLPDAEVAARVVSQSFHFLIEEIP